MQRGACEACRTRSILRNKNAAIGRVLVFGGRDYWTDSLEVAELEVADMEEEEEVAVPVLGMPGVCGVNTEESSIHTSARITTPAMAHKMPVWVSSLVRVALPFAISPRVHRSR